MLYLRLSTGSLEAFFGLDKHSWLVVGIFFIGIGCCIVFYYASIIVLITIVSWE